MVVSVGCTATDDKSISEFVSLGKQKCWRSHDFRYSYVSLWLFDIPPGGAFRRLNASPPEGPRRRGLILADADREMLAAPWAAHAFIVPGLALSAPMLALWRVGWIVAAVILDVFRRFIHFFTWLSDSAR